MRNLKTALLFIFLAVFASESLAQTFGIKAGLNLSTLLIKDNDETRSDDFDMRPGFHVGVTAEFPFSKMFSFQPEVLLSTKGYKFEEGNEDVGIEASMNPIYVDIPLLLKGNFDVSGVEIYGALGPYVGFGVGGDMKYKETYNGVTDYEEEVDIKWGNDKEEDDLKPFDAGLSIGAGATVNHILFGVAYDFGLANISLDNHNGWKVNNRVFRVSVGYVFGGGDTDKK